jgi:hypothetical protein
VAFFIALSPGETNSACDCIDRGEQNLTSRHAILDITRNCSSMPD